MAYSKAEVKSNCNKIYPCFRPFYAHDRVLTYFYLLYYRFHLNILIGKISFIGIPSSLRVLYNTLGIFLFITASRIALGPTQPPIQWVPGALPLGVKRPGREADHSPPSSAEVKE
jgi:hypothetical protein